MGRTSWADGEVLLASSAERRAASALVLVESVSGVGPLTRRLPRHAYAGCSTNPLTRHANIPSAHKLQPDAAHSAPTQPPVKKSKSRCSRLPLRGVGCASEKDLFAELGSEVLEPLRSRVGFSTGSGPPRGGAVSNAESGACPKASHIARADPVNEPDRSIGLNYALVWVRTTFKKTPFPSNSTYPPQTA